MQIMQFLQGLQQESGVSFGEGGLWSHARKPAHNDGGGMRFAEVYAGERRAMSSRGMSSGASRTGDTRAVRAQEGQSIRTEASSGNEVEQRSRGEAVSRNDARDRGPVRANGQQTEGTNSRDAADGQVPEESANSTVADSNQRPSADEAASVPAPPTVDQLVLRRMRMVLDKTATLREGAGAVKSSGPSNSPIEKALAGLVALLGDKNGAKPKALGLLMAEGAGASPKAGLEAYDFGLQPAAKGDALAQILERLGIKPVQSADTAPKDGMPQGVKIPEVMLAKASQTIQGNAAQQGQGARVPLEPNAEIGINRQGSMRAFLQASHTRSPEAIEGRFATKQAGAPLTPGASRVSFQDVGRQVIQSVRYMVGRGEQSMSVKLIPESLGDLHFTVRATGDALHVHMSAANQAVRESIENQLPQLREALSKGGPGGADVSVSVGVGSESLAGHASHGAAFSSAGGSRGDGPRDRPSDESESGSPGEFGASASVLGTFNAYV